MVRPKSLPLDNQHAVVTGGGRGIGAAVVRALASHGAAVTLMGRKMNQLVEQTTELRDAFDRTFHAVQVDVTDPESVRDAFAESRDAMGAPTILVNNAGAVETNAFSKVELNQWEQMLAVNLTGSFLSCREVLPGMIQLAAGRIVNVASTAGLRGYAYASAYTASKHGVVGLTRALALEMAKHGVTVNAVCPGYTDTDMLSDSAERVAKKVGRSVDDIKDTYRRSNPQGRLIEPEEVASVVVWLCLPAQRSLTGQAIAVDGGETI